MPMRRTILITLYTTFICTNTFGQSQKDSVAVYGNVKDSFTHEILKDVHVEIMNSDSTSIDEFQVDQIYRYGGYYHNIDRIGYLYIPRTDCIFRFSKEGYLPSTVNLRKKDIGKRETRISLGEILLKKKPRALERELDEVTVTASKVRMVVKGDTIVYNADAFQLAEGSMLDGLIKRLPGFEIKDGQIRVNGNFVSSLLVNGEDFFRGDPRVALENLPAYMVDKVKVYHKEHEYSYITREKDIRELPLVVDVNLKRQYSIGWVANASAGYGLSNRYLARLFGLRFTDNSRLALFGNANNRNDTREPGTTGEWNAQGATSGRTDLQTGGLEALIKDKKGVWKYTGNVKAAHRKTDDQSVTSVETFQPALSGNTYARSKNENINRVMDVTTAHQFSYKKPHGYITLDGKAGYHRSRNQANRWEAEFTNDPNDRYRAASLDSLFSGTSERLATLFVHRRMEQSLANANHWGGSVSMNGYIEIPHTPDYINLSADLRVQKQEATTFSDYHLLYNPSIGKGEDYRNQYQTSPVVSLDASLKASYKYRPEWGTVTPFYEMTEQYRDAALSLYRLDQLGRNSLSLGELPSTISTLMSCMDSQNSYTSRLNTLVHHVGVSLLFWLPGKLPSHRIDIRPEVEWRIDNLTYHRDQLNETSHRSNAVFVPSISWGFEDCYIDYRLSSSYPDMVSLIAYADNADPLNIYRGNPSLKRSTSHSVDFTRYLRNRDKGWQLSLRAAWDMTQNAIAHAMTYDAATGVRTYSPCNVDGNWGAKLSADYQKALDKKQRFVLNAVTGFNYRNSVDYVSELSQVRNLNTSENLRLNMRLNQYIFDLDVAVKYLHATSSRTGFQNINSFDFKYGASAQIPLSAGFAFTTDLTLYHRMGYSDASLNDCHFVANARLSKTLLKGRLGLSLDAYDIFQGLSNVTRVLNAQGLTETWYNSLPRYAMLQVIYKFSKQPKKK